MLQETGAQLRTGVAESCPTSRGPGFALVSRAADAMQIKQYTRTGYGYSRKRPPTANAMRTLELCPNAEPAPARAPQHDNSLEPCRKQVSGTSSEAARNVSSTAFRSPCHGTPIVCRVQQPAEAPRPSPAGVHNPVERWVEGDVSHLTRGWPGCSRRGELGTLVQRE